DAGDPAVDSGDPSGRSGRRGWLFRLRFSLLGRKTNARLSIFAPGPGRRDGAAARRVPSALSEHPAAGLSRLDRLVGLSARRPDRPPADSFGRQQSRARLLPPFLPPRSRPAAPSG